MRCPYCNQPVYLCCQPPGEPDEPLFHPDAGERSPVYVSYINPYWWYGSYPGYYPYYHHHHGHFYHGGYHNYHHREGYRSRYDHERTPKRKSPK